MDLGRIKGYLEIIDDEDISMGEYAEIDAAFRELVATGIELRDEPENAMARDQLEELEAHASPLEVEIYNWVEEHFGESEARDPSWSTKALADHLNQLPIILGAENGTIGALFKGRE